MKVFILMCGLGVGAVVFGQSFMHSGLGVGMFVFGLGGRGALTLRLYFSYLSHPICYLTFLLRIDGQARIPIRVF